MATRKKAASKVARKTTGRKAAAKKKAAGKKAAPAAAGAPALKPQEAMEVAGRAVAKAARMDAAGLVAAQAVTVEEADVTDELAKGGPAFGDFLKSVGLAVAESQKQLDASMVETAKAISDTEIDVIAVFEQQIKDDDGSMDKGIIHKQKLPLINYLMPTAYNFSRVYLEADMKVSEFNGAKGFNIQGKSESFSASASASYSLFGGFGAGGSTRYGQSSFSRSAEASVARDSAAGSLHMETTLEPRGDVQLPQPYIIQKGPRLNVRITSKSKIEEGDPVAQVGRKIELVAALTKTDGSAHSGKSIEISVSEPLFSFTVSGQTDANGEATITIENRWGTLAEGEAIPAPKQAIVRVWFGLVSESVGITL